MEKNKIQTSETFCIGAFLAIAGGYLDAYTYLMRGGVFANAQTGNIVLLGINIMEKDFVKAFSYLVPIGFFMIGIFVANIIKNTHRLSAIHWRQVVLGIEILGVIGVGLLPMGRLDFLANALVAFVCSLQVESFRKVNGLAFASTMCTGNLRSGTAAAFDGIWLRQKSHFEKSGKYFGVVGFFILGGIIGAFASKYLGGTGVFWAAIPLLVALLIMFEEEKPVSR
ncbi:MAG: YoaK family protein [Anaerovoracaceae bacterium]